MTGNCREPWNEDRPDLTRVGVEAAARMLYVQAERDYGELAVPFDSYRAEYEEDAVQILRAYQQASGG